MTERLRGKDLAVLARETARTPMHNATVEIFEPGGFGLRLRQPGRPDRRPDRVRAALPPAVHGRCPGRLANPVWVDDPDFDLAYHVRRSALPRPGSIDQLRELVARIMSRRLDRTRPLWEMYFVEGLEGGRIALLSKSHQVLVDGSSTVDIGQVLLDVDPGPRQLVHEGWAPSREQSPAALVLGAVAEVLDRAVGWRSTPPAARRRRSVVRRARPRAGSVPSRPRCPTGARPPSTPFNLELSEQRRVVFVRTALEDYRKVRRVARRHRQRRHPGHDHRCDPRLADDPRRVGATAGRRLRALVPMSVIDEELEATSLGSQVAGHLLNLPIGETSPVVRLHQVSYALQAHRRPAGRSPPTGSPGIAGFAPTTFHALGARVAAAQTRRDVNLVITNVPGSAVPDVRRGRRDDRDLPGAAAAARASRSRSASRRTTGPCTTASTPTATRCPTSDVLGQCVTEALDELVDTASRPGRARPARPPKPTRRSR